MIEYDGVKGGKYYCITTLKDFNEFYENAKVQNALAIDTETTGLDWVKSVVCGIVIGWGIENNYYIPVAHRDAYTGEYVRENLSLEAVKPQLTELFENKKSIKYFWNAKFDLHVLRKAGFEVNGPIVDGLIMSFLIDENADHRLKSMSNKFISKTANKWEKDVENARLEIAKKRRSNFTIMSNDLIIDYKQDLKLMSEVTAQSEALLAKEDLSELDETQIKRKRTTSVRNLLKEKAKEFLKGHLHAKNKKDHISYDFVDLSILAPYAAADVHYTWLLCKKLLQAVQKHKELVGLFLNETRLLRVLFEMESHGVKIDREYLKELSPLLEKEARKSEQQIYNEVGYEFNVGSTQQLTKALLDSGARLTKYTKTSLEKIDAGEIKPSEASLSVDSNVLEALAATQKFAKNILDYRGALKLKSTYVDGILEKLDDNDYIHSSFRQSVKTGRMSSAAPNCQNIPSGDKRIKTAFIVPDEKTGFFFFDYSQIELRLTAHVSQDPKLLSCYPMEGEGKDVHSLTCAEVILNKGYDEVIRDLENGSNHDKNNPLCACVKCETSLMRRYAKIVNFLIIYGGGGATMQKQVSTPERPLTVEQCKAYINQYMNNYYGVKKWLRNTEEFVEKNGYVQNDFGRFRRFLDIQHVENKMKYRYFRQASNFLIQSLAADLFKYAIVNVSEFLKGTGARIVNVVHDDIQFYIPMDKLYLIKDIVRIMEDFTFSVPIVVDVEFSFSNWAAKKGLKRSLLNDVNYDMLRSITES